MTPTLYEWAGGAEAIERLFSLFYARVPRDPVLAPVFADMPPEHARRVAFVGEVLGSSRTWSGDRGSP